VILCNTILKKLERMIKNMKSIEELIKYEFTCIDDRDKYRIVEFLTIPQLEKIGITLKKEYAETYKPKEFTRDIVLEMLKGDIEFGIEKALSERGISSSLMYNVVKMWDWILDEHFQDYDYHDYGIHFFNDVNNYYFEGRE
jgi:hypothetical protein